MAKGTPSEHAEILEYALSHLETERDKIQAKIDGIRLQLGTGGTTEAAAPRARRKYVRKNVAAATAAEVPAAAPGKKRTMTEAARKRIAAGQKRRWAEHRKKQKAE